MATTTFSGPVKAGTIKNTTGTTVGTDVTNVGSVVMAQSAVIDIIGAASADQVVATIPANSQIIDVVLNVTTVSNDGGAATVSVGTSGDANAFIDGQNVKALATTRGTLDTEATDVGSTDIQVLADFAAANGDGTTGAATVTVMYIQNNNLS
tara:strand:- start:1869 stop:2324 length:456 start_codon:yes stop_codon:yes gene_type:complete